jgi:hypothetical protein
MRLATPMTPIITRAAVVAFNAGHAHPMVAVGHEMGMSRSMRRCNRGGVAGDRLPVTSRDFGREAAAGFRL